MRTTHEYDNWHKGQKNMFISNEVHEKLILIRDMYRTKYHRNITLGDIVEGLLDGDEALIEMYNATRGKG